MAKQQQDKIKNRWNASYNYGLRAEFQAINQILKGVEKRIEWQHEDGTWLSTGVSQTDLDAIGQALIVRLNYEKQKKDISTTQVLRTDSTTQQELEETQPENDADKGEDTDNPLTDN